jgi:hypothetical protein
MSGHTPGPWEATQPDDFDAIWVLRNGTTVCVVSSGGVKPEQARANAALIAAGPDLLEACQKLIDYRNRNTRNWQTEKAEDYFRMIRLAITKATGQQEPS